MVQISYRTYNRYYGRSLSLSKKKIALSVFNGRGFSRGNIQWNILGSTGVEDQPFMCLTGQFLHSTEMLVGLQYCLVLLNRCRRKYGFKLKGQRQHTSSVFIKIDELQIIIY